MEHYIIYRIFDAKTQNITLLLPSNVLASKSQYLVIDDEVDLVYLFNEALSQIKDINVLAFSDPKLALEHFQKNSEFYQAVITDYRMPHMTGLELLSKIRDVKPAVRRVLINAFEIRDDLFQDCDCMDQFLQKPISMIDLINGVEKLVTKTNAVVQRLKEKILTTPSVLQAISNKESMELFNVIAEGKNSYQVVEVGMMTRKQYYPRLAKLVRLDLVKKVGKRYELTTFGSVIYEAQLTLAMAVNDRRKLIALESFETIQTSDGFTIKNPIVKNEVMLDLYVETDLT